ncbi:hypothetical protein QF035_003694 [Streptomyces umbrinus]|uniref:YokE-like PH domain-containing protein n=1 Tax=Streptomyces umbrinus TaxID=67370 RepID=A0ABU0SRK0_9ACTN|nr:hypothetical protein [Streptomyces umbrinus]MDQ1026112.1 hypothetical protein [Streptomyces umbrinus]
MRKDLEELLEQMPAQDAQELRQEPYAQLVGQIAQQLPADEYIICMAHASGRGWIHGVLVLTFNRLVFFTAPGANVIDFGTVAQVLPVAAERKRLFHSADDAKLLVHRLQRDSDLWRIHGAPEWGDAFTSAVRTGFAQWQLNRPTAT